MTLLCMCARRPLYIFLDELDVQFAEAHELRWIPWSSMPAHVHIVRTCILQHRRSCSGSKRVAVSLVQVCGIRRGVSVGRVDMWSLRIHRRAICRAPQYTCVTYCSLIPTLRCVWHARCTSM